MVFLKLLYHRAFREVETCVVPRICAVAVASVWEVKLIVKCVTAVDRKSPP